MYLKGKKKMKKRKILSILLISLYLLLTGYTYPQESTPYIVVDCNFGTNFVICFPVNQADYIKIDGIDVINCSSSTIYGYCSDGERINFPTFDTPYRSISYQQNQYLSVYSVVEDHLADYSTVSSFSHNREMFTFAMIGGILGCIMLLVLKR